jgi:hypothetical protein
MGSGLRRNDTVVSAESETHWQYIAVNKQFFFELQITPRIDRLSRDFSPQFTNLNNSKLTGIAHDIIAVSIKSLIIIIYLTNDSPYRFPNANCQ